MLNASFINNENAGSVMAWCAVGTLVLGTGMAIYQICNQHKQQETLEEARNSMKARPAGTVRKASRAS